MKKYRVNSKTMEEIKLVVSWDHGHFGHDAPYPYTTVDAIERLINGVNLADECGDYLGKLTVLGTDSVPLQLEKVDQKHHESLGLIAEEEEK
jgi:hypothetical protein